MESKADLAFNRYQTEQGGPVMREALKQIDDVGRLALDLDYRQINDAVATIAKISRRTEADTDLLFELGYKKLASGQSFQVGAHILLEAKRRLGRELDKKRIEQIAL